MRSCNDKISDEVVMFSTAKASFSSKTEDLDIDIDDDNDTRMFGWRKSSSISSAMIVDASRNFVFFLSLNSFKEFLVCCCNFDEESSARLISGALEIQDVLSYEIILEKYRYDGYPVTNRSEPSTLMADGFKLYHALKNNVPESESRTACAIIECLHATFMTEVPPEERLRKKPNTN